MATARLLMARFVIVTLALSFVFEAWMLRSAGGMQALGGLAVVILMWIPALVSFALRAIGRERWRDGGWRPGPIRYWLIAALVPVGCATFTYLASWAVGGVSFVARPSANPEPAWIRFLVNGLINAALGTLFGSLLAAGEEIGWRGYLLPRLIRSRIAAPILWSGVIWGVWHVPLIAFGDYATSSRPFVSVALFMIVVCVAAHFAAWLRLASGSVWPAVVWHASHNACYQGVFDPWFGGPYEPYLAGEAGAFSILAYAAVVFVLWQRGAFASATLRREEHELETTE